MKDKDLFIQELKTEAAKETIDDLLERGEDVVIDDFAGGNVDDAYNAGWNDGRASLAREVLHFLKEEPYG